MVIPPKLVIALGVIVIGLSALQSMAQSPATGGAAEDGLKLFAVEIRVGPTWDSSKSPNEQAYFKEHSANLKLLRDAGHIVMGARYSDKGLIIFAARSAEEVGVFTDEDPSMAAGTFVYEVHAFNVFYSGLVQAGSR